MSSLTFDLSVFFQISLYVSPFKKHIAPRLTPLNSTGPTAILKPGLWKSVLLGKLLGLQPFFNGFPVPVRECGLYFLPHYDA